MNEIPVKIQESSILKTVDKNDIDLEEQNEIVIVEAFYNDICELIRGENDIGFEEDFEAHLSDEHELDEEEQCITSVSVTRSGRTVKKPKTHVDYVSF